MIVSSNMNIANNIQIKYQQIENPKVAIVSITQDGRAIARRIQEMLFPAAVSFVRVTEEFPLLDTEEALVERSAVKTLQYAIQTDYHLIIAIMATGITIRAIAPLLQDKTIDPAIIGMDDQGQFVISLLSGHVGNANEWSRKLATELKATAVITTATDASNRIGIDDLAKSVKGYYRDFKEQTRRFNQMIADNRKVAVINETSFELPPSSLGFDALTWEEWNGKFEDYEGLVVISCRPSNQVKELVNDLATIEWVQIIPRQYIVGVGCRKDTPYEILRQNYDIFMQEMNLDIYSVNKFVSIDVKKDEFAIISLTQTLGTQFETFSKEILEAYEGLYKGSEFVKQTVGVSSVAQASAHHETNGNVISERYANQGVTFALAKY